MEKENELRPNMASEKNGKTGHVIGHVVAVIAIVILLLMQLCTGKKHEAEKLSWNNEKDSLINNGNLLQRRCDSLKNALRLCDSINNDLASKNNTLQKENKKLKNLYYGLKNSKAVLNVTDTANGKLVKAMIVPKRIEGKSEIFIENPKSVYVPELLYSCIGDSIEISLNELSKDGLTPIGINNFKSYKSQSSADLLGTKPGSQKSSSCFDLNFSKRNYTVYSWTVNEGHKDGGLIKKANRKMWVSNILDLAAMVGYNRLYHARPLASVTYNGLAPNDSNNPYASRNNADKRANTNRSWGEAGVWTGWIASKAFGFSAQKDYNNAYYFVPRTYSIVLNF